MPEANYQIVRKTDKSLIIRDIGPWSKYMTITNAAEEVVQALAPQLIGRRLFYYDSEDEFGELLIEAGRFTGFKFARPSDAK